jgi:hypothetical protein
MWHVCRQLRRPPDTPGSGDPEDLIVLQVVLRRFAKWQSGQADHQLGHAVCGSRHRRVTW